MNFWWDNSIFYHIYPLGLCGAPDQNDYNLPVNHRIDILYDWIGHLKNIGVNAVYIGPFFESGTHGYDTSDYYHIDRRLGDRNSFAKLVSTFHENGIRVIFDAVFNHVGRDFWAFRDVLKNGKNSPYCDWFHGLNFNQRSPFGDPFNYHSWNGHYKLVKLNLKNKDVREHLLKATEMWIHELGADGLRIDAADCIDLDFLRELRHYTKSIKPDFWLLGEIIHGDYRIWANENTLDSVTNYECYKGLYSCFNDKNMFELAHTLSRQSGNGGLYKHLNLYSFLDNHDVERIATILKNKDNLYPVYSLLFTIPGIPSVYYGSEFGINGKKSKSGDHHLRPYLDINNLINENNYSNLTNLIKKLSQIRKENIELRTGEYIQISVALEQFSFMRKSGNEKTIVVINASDNNQSIQLRIPETREGKLIDLLNNNDAFYISNNEIRIDHLLPHSARILKLL